MSQDSYIALKRSEMEFRALSEQAAIGVTKTETATGKYVFVNQRFADIVGYTRDELLTMSFHALTDPADLAEDLDNLGRLVKGDLHEYSMEKRYRRKDGTTIWVSLTVSPLWLEGESPRYVIGVVEDITDRKQAEDALRESERRLREAQEMAHLGFWNWDVKTGDVEWSEEVFRIFGLDPEEFTPQIDSILALSPWPEDNHRDKELIDLATKTHSPGFYEQKFLRPDKSVGHYCSTFQGNYDENGKLLSIVGTVLDITERKLAEDKLRVAQLQWNQFLEASPDPMWIKDTSGRYVAANKTYYRVEPSVNGDIVGKTDAECFPPEKAAVYVADDRVAIKNGVSEGEFTAVDVDGKFHNFLTKKVVLRGPDGSVAGTLGISRDITDRKRAADALRESEERLREVLENSLDASYKRNLQTDTYDYLSSVFVKITGYTPDELKTLPHETVLRMTHPDDRAEIERVIAKAVSSATGTEYQVEYRLKHKEGQYRWVQDRFTVMRDAGGQPLARIGSVRDITERKRAEEENQRERAFFDQLVETAPEGVAITGEEGKVLRVNAEFVRMFGYEANEAVGQCIDDLVAPPARQEEARAITRSSGQGEESVLETVRRRKDGTLVDVSLISAPILVAGKQEAVYAIYRDITERKQAEAQLRQSQKMEAIGTLAGGVAHDFNNLLTGILGNIALMRSSLPPADPLLENLNAAEISARQAAALTKGLLTFGRSAVVLPVPMKIMTALEASLTLLKQSLPATMEIVRDYEQPAWNVLLDQSQMTQILLNLAVNARDAMKGKGTLTIRARNEVIGEEYLQTHPFARTGEFIHLSFMDTGPGMSSEVMQHLFEPFYTTKPVGSGTGLGLSVVYGAVKQAGGWITAVSTEGIGRTTPHIGQTCSGATFDIYLPRCLEEPRQSLPPASIPVNIGSGTVLVVEDEPVVCAVAQALLSRSGYTVLTAPDGVSALNVLHEHLADIGLILLDMTMPGMTNGEVVQAIRALDPTVPILLNSGYTSNGAVKQMLDEGSVQGFLGKPYDLPQLLENVQRLLRRG